MCYDQFEPSRTVCKPYEILFCCLFLIGTDERKEQCENDIGVGENGKG